MDHGFFTNRLCLLFIFICSISTLAQDEMKGSLEVKTLESEFLKENKIGLDIKRNLQVYLPPGYTTSTCCLLFAQYIR